MFLGLLGIGSRGDSISSEIRHHEFALELTSLLFLLTIPSTDYLLDYFPNYSTSRAFYFAIVALAYVVFPNDAVSTERVIVFVSFVSRSSDHTTFYNSVNETYVTASSTTRTLRKASRKVQLCYTV